MASYLILWNPRKFAWKELPRLLDQIERGEDAIHYWGVANRKTMDPGSIVYLLESGSRYPGIRGRGVVVAPPVEYERLEEGDHRINMQVKVQYLELQDRDEPSAIPRDQLQSDPELSGVDWKPQRGGVKLPPEIASKLDILWRELYGGGQDIDFLPEGIGAMEGDLVRRLVTHRRRERSLRQQKLTASRRANGGHLICEVCTLNLTHRFGTCAYRVAEVHHLLPLSDGRGPRRTGLEDLAVVCPNCHRFIHSRTPLYTLEAAREVLIHE